MKLVRWTFFLLAVVCPAFSASGQNKAKKAPAASKIGACRSNDIAFPCPKGFQNKSGKAPNSVYVAYGAKSKVGIFLFAPAGELDEKALIDETLKPSLKNLYLSEYEDYEWKDSDDFNGDEKWSKYETAKYARVGYNKNKGQTIHLQLVRLSFKEKDILAGFVYELAGRQQAEQEFKSWTGGGNGDASEALQELVTRVTGEGKSDSTPGGPPRMAMPINN